MIVIRVRNAHCGLSEGLHHLRTAGLRRESRNGPVLVLPHPVATVFTNPVERVVFWPQRDANPFLHLYESLWMLMGRNDVAPLLRYTKQFAAYSDNGETLHGAYGYRWRHAFGRDQLDLIVGQLRRNHDDRRCVLQMWDAPADLASSSKDVPCNLMVTFQINVNGNLDMVVFNRSNDIVWGLYGANVVHFSVLHEYMAHRIEVPVGEYTHVSVNFHAYVKLLEKMPTIPVDLGVFGELKDPYTLGEVYTVNFLGDVDAITNRIFRQEPFDVIHVDNFPLWARVALRMFQAHRAWQTLTDESRYKLPISLLKEMDPQIDWVRAGLEWLQRRHEQFLLKGQA